MNTKKRRLIIWSIVATGISSVSTQLLTIREFLSQVHGNEITISLVIFCWLATTGLGSLIAKWVKRPSQQVLALLLIAIAIWPLLQLVSIRVLREAFFTHGTSPGFYPVFLYIIGIISPYCLLTGFILPYAQKVVHDHYDPFDTADLYIMDNIGDIMGGILFSLVLVYWLTPFPTVALTSSLLILIVILLLFRAHMFLLLIAALVCFSTFYYYSTNTTFEKLTLMRQYGEIVRYLESPYGRIVISRQGAQLTFWEAGTPLYSDADVARSEEKVHYPLSQLHTVENVLLISGGLGETIAEISKYHPLHVDYVELDPYLTDTALKLGAIKKVPFLEIVNTDGRRYIKEAQRSYDAIIVDLPDPDTFQVNRFFTGEFFALAKRILKRNGVLCISMQYSPNYLSEIRIKKLSILYHTARLHFQNLLVLPGGEAYFLCSDGKLAADIPEKLKMKSIPTSYIQGAFYGNVTKERISQLKRDLDRNAPVNKDFEPRLLNVVFMEWFTKYHASPQYFLLGLFVLTLVYLLFIKKAEYVLFTTGLVTMGVEMLVIFAFQVIYGYIYLKIGAIVTACLLGLLPGALAAKRWKSEDALKLKLSELLILFLLILFFGWLMVLRHELHPIYFLAYCLLFSFACGFQFPVVASIIGEQRSPAAGCFAADLWGASIGTLATGTILIPLWGAKISIIFLILLKISSSAIIFLTMRSRT